MIKKTLVSLAILFVSAFVFSAINYSSVFANSTSENSTENSSTLLAKKDNKNDDSDNEDEDGEGGTNNANDFGVDGTCNYVLGFTSWNCNVDIHDQETLKSGIWTIVANILTDITVAAAYLVLGFVIYGGYLYMSSSGDSSKVANGKKTLTQAFIGLAIVMGASVILNTIRIALGANFTGNCATNECVDPSIMVTNLIQYVIGMAGAVAVIFIVVGGFGYITSAGDPAKLQKAKQTILYACIGIIVVALAEVITAFVSNIIREGISQVNQTTIAKELHEKNT